MAVGRAPGRARRGGSRALLLGPFGLRQLVALALTLAVAGCAASGSTETGRAPHQPPRSHPAVVTRVTDGDTVWLSGIGKTRLIGIDTPEVYFHTECFGRAASAFTKRVLHPGTRIYYRLGVDPEDRFGRALAYVWLRDGRMFNELLAREGYATPLTIPPNVDYADRFVAASRAARAAGRGLWSVKTCNGENPPNG